LADEDAVGVDERPPRLAYLRIGLTQELDAVCAGVARLARRKQRADVAEGSGAEHGVDQRVSDHVPVGVARKAARMVESDPAEDERHAVGERVRVEPDADAEAHCNAPGSSSSDSIRIAAGGGVCRWPHGPRRTCTATMPAASAGATALSTRSPTYAIFAGG